MKCVLVWLAVMTTTFHTSQAVCEDGGKRYSNGTIRVLGINTTHTLAGRIEICVETEWWAVCENGWGSDDASAVCRRLGFTESLYCTDSCFGKSSRNKGIREFQCAGSDCSTFTRDDDTRKCGKDAGIVCSNPKNRTTQPPPSCSTTPCPITPTTICPMTTCPTCPTHALTRAVDMTDSTANTSTHNLVGEKNQPSESCPSLAALGGGLGGLCAILAILLVGVVMGWVWSCHRTTGKPESSEFPLDNPTYSSFITAATLPEPSPAREAPTPSAPPSSQQPPIYAVVDKKKKATHLSQEVEQEERGEEEGGGGEVGNHEGHRDRLDI